jgi:hypothetical protein
LSNATSPLAGSKRTSVLFAPTPDEPIVEHAVYYAINNGWPVLVVNPDTKIPHKSAAHSNGERWGQTTDPEVIRGDFTRWPKANVGIATGEAAGFFVVETDTADGHGEGVDGAVALAALEAEHATLPPTLEAESPSGSIHRYFKHPGFKIKNSGSEVAPGVDVRGDGGMVVAPPSVKRGKGAYIWRNNLPIAEAPQWLLDRIVAGKGRPEPELSIAERASALVGTPAEHVDPYAAHAAAYSATGDGYSREYLDKALSCERAIVVGAAKGNRNHQLNKSSYNLGQLVPHGLGDREVIDAMYEAAVRCGHVADNGRPATMATINSVLKDGIANPRPLPQAKPAGSPPAPDNDNVAPDGVNSAPKPPPQLTPIRATPYVWTDPAIIPQREWLYGRLLLRKFVSATVSPGGVGKSSLIAAEALAMVSGKPLLGVKPDEPLRVWLWNLEDPLEETTRKIQAAAIHYHLEQDDIGDRLMIDSGRDQRLVIATSTRNGAVIVQPVVDSLVDEIIKHQIDVLMIDPFVSCHEVAENDNSAMDMVLKEWGRVAGRGNCAVHLVHHTRKPGGADGEVTTDSSRGGSSQTDACRVVRPINRMSEKEATAVGVDNHRLYFRTLHDKANLQPPAERSDWFKLESVDLGNGPMGLPGDSVGVVTNWELPEALAGVTGADFDKVACVIRGGKWRHSPQSTAWVGKAVAEALHLDIDDKKVQAKVKRMLGVWYAAKSLVIVEGQDERREVRKFVEVAESN